ncbi:MAG TPA: dTMP kinase [Bacillota bacterium]|nr:dTMP kinase [Bacillota bacterium]
MTRNFITFEGGEGSGKTTIIQRLAERLKENNYDVVTTREPGGVKIAEQIREVILNKDNQAMDGRTEALLYAAARRQHLVETVIPHLRAGKVVLCDRFIDSSLAYQGYARGLGVDEVMAVNAFAIDHWMPSLTLFLDIEPEKGLERIQQNETREINRLDLEHITFHHKVYEGYKALVETNKDRIQVVQAEQSIEAVERDAFNIILSHIQRKN